MRRLTQLLTYAVAVAAVALAWPNPPTSAAAPAKSICVGLVVDAHAMHGPVATDCATVPADSTGYDVLRAAGHTVEFRRDGLICTIDHRPSNGCAGINDSHYWAYFHRAPGSSQWTYSNEGATTYQPPNGSTEGWVWQNGASTKPEDIPAARICPPSPSPTPSSAATTVAPTAAGQPTTPTPRRTRHHRSVPATTAATPAPPSPTATAAAVTAPGSSTTRSSSSGPSAGLVIGLGATALLGGAAAVRWRRRGSD